MDIWYTPERLELQREIAQRRVARYKRREAMAVREERRKRVLGFIEGIVGIAITLFGFWVGCLWAFL